MKTEAMPAKTEFKFHCPTCGQHILVATQWSGLEISCPSCQRRITIPAPSSDERSTPSAMSPNRTGQTIRIELPLKASQSTAGANGQAKDSKTASVVTPTVARVEDSQRILGNEPWRDLVRKLEKGALVAPAELATALFHELMEVRRRLDQLESRLASDKLARTDEIWRGTGEGGLQDPKRLEVPDVDSNGNGSGRQTTSAVGIPVAGPEVANC